MNSPSDVLHVVSSDAFAGVERHVVRLCAGLQGLDCRVRIACPRSAERIRTEAELANIRVVPPVATQGPWAVRALARAIARPPAIVHVHDGRSAAVAAATSPVLPSLLVRTQHFVSPASVERTGWKRPTSLSAHRALSRRYDGYIAVSSLAAAEALKRGEIHRAVVEVIPPGVILASDVAAEAARSHRRAFRDEPIVAFIGRFEVEKRIDVLIRAMPEVLRRFPTVRFVLAGTGREAPALKGLAEALGVNDRIEWPGWVPEPDPILSRAHVYVNTWPREGFGMAMAEAMGYEVPVVAPDSGASPEIVVDGVNGLLVLAEDPSSLAAAIVKLASDPELAASMGRAGRERAISRYGVRQTAESTLEFYQRLLQATAA